MKKKKAFSQAGTEIVKNMLKSGWMIAFITVFSLIAAFAAYSAMTAGLYSGMAARIAFAALYAYAAAQLVILQKKADVKALRRLTCFCLLLCVGTWILAGITLILTVLCALGIDSQYQRTVGLDSGGSDIPADVYGEPFPSGPQCPAAG